MTGGGGEVGVMHGMGRIKRLEKTRICEIPGRVRSRKRVHPGRQTLREGAEEDHLRTGRKSRVEGLRKEGGTPEPHQWTETPRSRGIYRLQTGQDPAHGHLRADRPRNCRRVRCGPCVVHEVFVWNLVSHLLSDNNKGVRPTWTRVSSTPNLEVDGTGCRA